MQNLITEIKSKYTLSDNIILSALRGSITHGTSNNVSDIDINHIYIGNLNHYFGFDNKDSYTEKIDNLDIAAHELRKALGLLFKCNPDIINLLWTDEKFFLQLNEHGRELINHRDIFLSKLAYTSFSSYAMSQFKKMESLSPERLDELERVEKILIEHGVPIPNTGVTQKIRDIQLGDNYCITSTGYALSTVDAVIKHYTYLNKTYFNGGGRLGAKRRKAIKELGFNAKNSAHLIRLLKQGTEVLKEGKVYVDRSNIDKELLIDIKNGKYTLKEIKEMARDLNSGMEEAYNKSSLPDTADFKKIERLGINLIANYYRNIL